MSTCAGRRDYLNIYFWYFSPCAPCQLRMVARLPFFKQPLFILAVFMSSTRFSTWTLFIPLLCIFCGTGCLVCSSASHSSPCVCVSALENERGIRWLFFPYSSPCAITVLIMWLTVKPPVSIHCADSSLYNFPSSVRKGMAVSTITAVKAGLLLFSGPETARYARWCNTYKGVFSPIFSWRSRRLSHSFLMGMLLSSSFLYIL